MLEFATCLKNSAKSSLFPLTTSFMDFLQNSAIGDSSGGSFTKSSYCFFQNATRNVFKAFRENQNQFLHMFGSMEIINIIRENGIHFIFNTFTLKFFHDYCFGSGFRRLQDTQRLFQNISRCLSRFQLVSGRLVGVCLEVISGSSPRGFQGCFSGIASAAYQGSSKRFMGLEEVSERT